ncbi:sulfatase [Oceaniferula spumae]|uniref:Sulfatase n=1 Tax=Oceaniferula spumae TaxID=2979115 RepID=A0AAT9FPJ5_9BACT
MNSINRRTFLSHGLAGIGSLAFSRLCAGDSPLAIPHYRPKIKRVIHLCMAGGPSHLESFDYKPELAKLDGKAMPESFTKGQQLAQLQGKALRCMGPQWKFSKHGQSQMEISEIFPHIAKHADDIAVIRSMHTEQINHDPAHTFMNTGSIIPGRPSMGSWVLYGLGSESQNLPGYVVLTSAGGGQGQPISSRQWSSGLLPGHLQGVEFQSAGDPVHYVKNPKGITKASQKDVINAINRLNGIQSTRAEHHDIATRIEQYELAFRMQSAVPELMDTKGESQQTLDLYGCKPGDGSFASNCLLARRLAERGTRFIQLYHRGWDHHGQVKSGTKATAKHVDQGTSALLTDLKQRGMLDETLVIWGGEFGRTPMAQGSGRDHHIKAFSVFLAGGGIKGGTVYGKTDDLGYGVVENPVSVHDLHATMLHLLGLQHEALTFKAQGLDFKLTGVEPCKVIKGILA